MFAEERCAWKGGWEGGVFVAHEGVRKGCEPAIFFEILQPPKRLVFEINLTAWLAKHVTIPSTPAMPVPDQEAQ